MLDRINGVLFFGGVLSRRSLQASRACRMFKSWMPQIGGHLQTWTAENSQALRVFFRTIVTEEMIDGQTRAGTRHVGLGAFANNGIFRAAYNLSNIVEGAPGAVAAFDAFVDSPRDTLGVA